MATVWSAMCIVSRLHNGQDLDKRTSSADCYRGLLGSYSFYYNFVSMWLLPLEQVVLSVNHVPFSMVAPLNAGEDYDLDVPRHHVVLAVGCDPREDAYAEMQMVKVVLLNLTTGLMSIGDLVTQYSSKRVKPYPAVDAQTWADSADASDAFLRYGISDWVLAAAAAPAPA